MKANFGMGTTIDGEAKEQEDASAPVEKPIVKHEVDKPEDEQEEKKDSEEEKPTDQQDEEKKEEEEKDPVMHIMPINSSDETPVDIMPVKDDDLMGKHSRAPRMASLLAWVP